MGAAAPDGGGTDFDEMAAFGRNGVGERFEEGAGEGLERVGSIEN